MTIVNVPVAEANLSQLLARVEAGEEIVLVRGEVPIAKLVPYRAATGRRFGTLRGTVSVGPEFFQPLSEDEVAAWG